MTDTFTPTFAETPETIDWFLRGWRACGALETDFLAAEIGHHGPTVDHVLRQIIGNLETAIQAGETALYHVYASGVGPLPDTSSETEYPAIPSKRSLRRKPASGPSPSGGGIQNMVQFPGSGGIQNKENTGDLGDTDCRETSEKMWIDPSEENTL